MAEGGRGWQSQVVRLLHGESLDELNREMRVGARRLQAWHDEFAASGIEGLKGKPLAPEDRRLREAERKIDEMTISQAGGNADSHHTVPLPCRLLGK